jgi:hypothetical protein
MGKERPERRLWRHDTASSPTATHPAVSVLFDSAKRISDLLRELAEAAVDLNRKVWEIYFEAVKQAVGSIDLSDGLDLEDAKEGAQTAVRNIDQHSGQIKAWLGPPPPTNGEVIKLVGPGPHGEVTGTSVTKQPYDPADPMTGFKEGGMNAKPIDVKNIDTRLKYDPSLDPPLRRHHVHAGALTDSARIENGKCNPSRVGGSRPAPPGGCVHVRGDRPQDSPRLAERRAGRDEPRGRRPTRLHPITVETAARLLVIMTYDWEPIGPEESTADALADARTLLDRYDDKILCFSNISEARVSPSPNLTHGVTGWSPMTGYDGDYGFIVVSPDEVGVFWSFNPI